MALGRKEDELLRLSGVPVYGRLCMYVVYSFAFTGAKVEP